MQADLTVGVDCSTSSCKAMIWGPDGACIAHGRAPIKTITPHPLWHEQDADSWWIATTTAIKKATSGLDSARLAGMCITHQRETFVPVDAAGRPLRNALLWMDERAGALLPDLAARFGRERFHQATGKPLSGNLSVSKIAWLRDYEPDTYARTAQFLDVQAYLVGKLSGKFASGWGSADPMGLFDMRQKRWSETYLAVLDLSPEQFPEVYPAGRVIGEVNSQAASECGLPTGLPIVAGIGDGQAAGLGAGIIQAGDSYLSLGTSVVSGAFSDRYLTSHHFRTTFGGLPKSYLLETVILGGAYTIEWLIHQVLKSPADSDLLATLEAEAGDIPAGAEGLILLPYWNSAMNPYWDAYASGVMLGLRGVHGRGHIYRAILEGIAFEQRLHNQGIESVLGAPIRRLITMGGGAQSALWRQIISDISGIPVYRAVEDEAAALGAGILASVGCGLYADIRQATREMAHLSTDICQPDPRRSAIYREIFEQVFRHIYPDLRARMAALAQIRY